MSQKKREKNRILKTYKGNRENDRKKKHKKKTQKKKTKNDQILKKK